MRQIRALWTCLAISAAGVAMTGPASAACQNTQNFERWLDGVKKEAAAAGISQTAIAAALDGVTLDPGIIARDRRQGVFQQPFLQFSDRMVSRDRMQQGALHLRKHADLLARSEKQHGVPGLVIV